MICPGPAQEVPSEVARKARTSPDEALVSGTTSAAQPNERVTMTIPAGQDPASRYGSDPIVERLAEAHPDCATFAVRRGPATLVGATPERLVRVRQHGVDVSVLAGTARRGESRTDDRARGLALLAAAKERHEHALVLSAVRDALGPLCARVSSPESPRLLRTQAVQHLWTPVRGVLRPEAGLFDCVAALHPTPAVCGTPRETARSLIESSEGLARGWWSGGVGWSDGRGGEVSVVLRSALLRDREALLCAGAGIVAGSRWEDELEETRLKLRPMLAALVEV